MYAREIKECSGVLSLGSDYVFISNSLGTQTNIGTALDEIALPLLASEDEECLQQMFKVICHYYLPPCGNITHHSLHCANGSVCMCNPLALYCGKLQQQQQQVLLISIPLLTAAQPLSCCSLYQIVALELE